MGNYPTQFTDVDVEGTLNAEEVSATTLAGFHCVANGFTCSGTSASKADNYALDTMEKSSFISLSMTAASKTFTLGLPLGMIAIVKNVGATNAFTVKNVSGDTGTSLAAGKSLLIIGNSTTNGSTVIALD